MTIRFFSSTEAYGSHPVRLSNPTDIFMPMRPVILGSRSPRRQELLKLLVPAGQIVIKPPRSAIEAGFDKLTQHGEIMGRLREIIQAKQRDVDEQLSPEEKANGIALVADTIIVVTNPNGTLAVLGQPPEHDWQATVGEWFVRYYSGQAHQAWTGLCLWDAAGVSIETIVTTTVVFRDITPADLDWYLGTEESVGKAGGYALQGLASVFVRRVEGSLTNVVGLPLEFLRRALPGGGYKSFFR